jgi:ATP-dependent DNA ligase
MSTSTTEIVKSAPVVVKRKREGIQLCKVYQPGKKANPKKFLMEPKFDGIRGIVIVRDGFVEALTSTGLPVYNVDHIKNMLFIASRQNPELINNRVLDGEFLNPEIGFDATSGLSRKFSHDPAALEINFYVWDRLSVSQFDEKVCNEPIWHRKESLAEIISAIGQSQIINVEYAIGESHEDIVEAARGYKAEGNEGIVIKDYDGLYEFRKSKAWLKWKPDFQEDGLKEMKEGDFMITGLKPGRGKHAGRAGALFIEGYLQEDGNISPDPEDGGQKITGKVGTGPSDQERIQFQKWYEEGTLNGRVVEVRYQELSKDGSVRFPVFYRLREDKDEQ